MDKKQIGLRVKGLRAAKGLSQEELAKKLNIDRTTVSKIETGENAPTANILVELKGIFSISIDWLLTGKGPEPVESDDKDVSELLDAIKNRIVKHAVLGFFYQYKANNPGLFEIKKPGKPHHEIKRGEK